MLRNTLPTLLGLASASSAVLYETKIETNYGSVQGYPAFNSSNTGNLTHWKEITVWKGIPFAATTGGTNRWKAPQPASPWNGTLDARNWGPVCPSATTGDNSYTINEDCLNLNIWSPATSTDAKLPVVMWSYPAESTAADPLFDGGGMADKGIVFVNYNYRTGPFGWLAHSELSEEFEKVTGSNSSGNWGMLDQFAALKWIHANIEAFGGDPNQITVQGQSAGSAATQHIFYSNLTKGLIVGAIIDSGVRDPHDPLCTSLAEAYTTLDDALDDGNTYLSNLGVSSIAEARNLSMEALIDGATGSTREDTIMFEAVLDYYAMPDTYLNILKKGLAHNDENGATYGLDISLAEYFEDLNETYSGEWVERFFDLYLANDSTTASGAYNSMFTDRSKSSGAYHGSEINYVSNNLYATDKPWTAEDYAIAKNMNHYWASFIKTRNPNTQAEGATEWPAVNTSKLVQHVGDGWGQIPIAWSKKVKLFEDWFATLVAY
ncbi:carboxylesterase [Aspergillus neoniger CBS 115656]|uniref:Carboxylic ester hydrolase n=1 Tax=Aspergillus neoniger (strain CBS 115656) TaxID=1448310 RepID=A0A318YLS8_ASPNB|nr:carboxylesterase [Aspergillus neoniger CBS 115656]PYH35329.1 carboxylesterase [Aspergillus neoniger CBS 115656]